MAHLLGWNLPEGPFLGTLYLGSTLALLVYFRHDWASLVSSLLSIVLLRKKPMTLDERMPFFILLTTLPLVIVWQVFGERIRLWEASPETLILGFLILTLPLWMSESFNRRQKKMFDWNWVDAVFAGIYQLFYLIPGVGRNILILTVSFFRNYHREAAAKYLFYTLMPLLIIKTTSTLQGKDLTAASPTLETSWLTTGVAFTVSFLCGLLAIGGFMRNIQEKKMRGYAVYRFLLGLGFGVLIYLGIRFN